LWEWAKEVLTQEKLNNIFLGKDEDEKTPWHMAAQKRQIQVLNKLWEWAKEVLAQEHLNKVFLDKDKSKSTTWQMAAKEG
jgi:hypothetical protein